MLKKPKSINWRNMWRVFCTIVFCFESIAVLVRPNITDAYAGLAFLIIIVASNIEDEMRERRTISIESKVHLHQYICMDEDGKPIVITRREAIKLS